MPTYKKIGTYNNFYPKFGAAVTSVEVESKKLRKRPARYSKFEDEFDTSGMPIELREDPKMYKYWMKRHKLFHRSVII